jgi:hypothetical protein
MGGHGHRVDFDAAHYQATRFNELVRLGGWAPFFMRVVCWRRQHFAHARYFFFADSLFY